MRHAGAIVSASKAIQRYRKGGTVVLNKLDGGNEHLNFKEAEHPPAASII